MVYTAECIVIFFHARSKSTRAGDYTFERKESTLLTCFANRTCALDAHDVGYIFEEMWHGKSIVSGPNDRLALTRWVASEPLSYHNTVCMTREEAKAHERLPADVNLREHYGDGML